MEKCNQEAFEIATTVDPSFLLTIPCSKTPLNKYLSSTIMLVREKCKEILTSEENYILGDSINRLTSSEIDEDPAGIGEDDAYDNL
ncbi:unnamed protein product [Arctia plantaginis]|uniref:Uncharacterized protein n=1 Tax=Arctia plantaginis TaxID=874455 RepID=A0A8S0ZWZ4_ARCPL|nr:unnamed protein product [Arctia plantaginis]